MIDIVYHYGGIRMARSQAANGRSSSAASRRRREWIDPELRDLLDLIAEELAAEYLRLVRPRPEEQSAKEV